MSLDSNLTLMPALINGLRNTQPTKPAAIVGSADNSIKEI